MWGYPWTPLLSPSQALTGCLKLALKGVVGGGKGGLKRPFPLANPFAPTSGGACPAVRNLGNYPRTKAIWYIWYIHTCFFLCNVYPYTPSFPLLLLLSYIFGPLPPTNGAFVACPQYGMGRV